MHHNKSASQSEYSVSPHKNILCTALNAFGEHGITLHELSVTNRNKSSSRYLKKQTKHQRQNNVHTSIHVIMEQTAKVFILEGTDVFFGRKINNLSWSKDFFQSLFRYVFRYSTLIILEARPIKTPVPKHPSAEK